MGKDTLQPNIPATLDKPDEKGKMQQQKPQPDPYGQWGITPSKEARHDEVGKDHPVHKIPLAKQEKMRAKGVNPVLKAEMDEATKGKGGFWAKLGMTSLGGGWIK
ncbi:hypothetical protein FE257_005094 [Aspergillus nanangensis]|uniref:Uncharacterized protein n=1 Tax=Aspergillus nanangensis TaxID=2582783 RepID=A0AAD4CRM4_ASPNN|nr:hypothetical protein FE257_005094 [Aspergillus nanangensis]